MSLLIFCTSFSVLAYEILLIRLLSIVWWHHFAYMVISLALLGFGASGVLLFLLYAHIERKFDHWLFLLAVLTALSFSLGFSFSQQTGLDPLQLIWQKKAWAGMFLTYLFMGIPFLFAGAVIGIILTRAGENAHRMYALDLVGAGCGALLVVPALYMGPPWFLLPLLGAFVLFGSSGTCLRIFGALKGISLLVTVFGLIVLCYLVLPPTPKIHHTKGLPMILSLPDAGVEAKSWGPQGIIQVVGSSSIREAAGLSLTFSLDEESRGSGIPSQKMIFLDAESLGPLTRFNGDRQELQYLDYTTQALPYHVRHPQKVIVLGPGGGTDVLLALRQGTKEILALEANPQVADLLKQPFASFTGELYGRPEITLKIGEARQLIHSTDDTFDLIQLSLLDSFGASAGGLASAEESYLYTVEAFCLYLSRLSDFGMIAVTRWLKLPPRDSFRVFATALEALRKTSSTSTPERHLLFIRSWKTSTILISRSAFSDEEIASAARFCDRRGFDMAYHAGLKKEKANRFDRLKEPYYFLGASALSSEKADDFLDAYVFNVFPTTDNRPYFSHFFRWDKAFFLFRQLRAESLPLIELGYVFIVATLVQALVAGGIFILVPLIFLGRIGLNAQQWKELPSKGKVAGTLLYFGLIGLAFMFMEMALLPKFTFLLAHPIYSAALVLSSVLIFAGCGSLNVGRLQARWHWFLWLAVAGIFFWIAFMALLGEKLFAVAFTKPLWVRLLVAIGLSGFLAFFLGWPFPAGLRVTSKHSPKLVPWVWGVNGCASVVGAVMGKILSISFGFQCSTIVAGILYLGACLIFYALPNRGDGASAKIPETLP
ncbi:MAG: SAM-dependent methyltransferase [Deltaproteobacteria bacterium]|nr:SAM-dependent methyltransferase [Deltaproteobacteria bacterium]